MGKRVWSPLPAVSDSIAWLALGVSCSHNMNEHDLAPGPSHSQNPRIRWLQAICSCIQIIWSRLVHSRAAAVSGVTAGERREVAFAWPTSFLWGSYTGFAHLSNFPLLKTWCKNHSGCSSGLSVSQRPYVTSRTKTYKDAIRASPLCFSEGTTTTTQLCLKNYH